VTTRASIIVATVALASAPAIAQPTAEPPVRLTVGGFLEAYYQAQFQNASNSLTNLRGFDNRSRTFTLSNVALDVKGEKGPITGHVVLQIGHTPSTYYLAEPVSLGTGSVDTSSGELWKYVQVASLTAKLPNDWVLEAGLLPSPIGIEVIPIKDNFNWSRSNLFFGLPFYHTGITAAHPIAGGWTGKLHVYNGWNSVVDNNRSPSVSVSAGYASDTTTAQVLYFGGDERPTGALEGAPWRNLLDAYVQHALTSELTIAAQGDVGIEPNDIGTSAWAAIAGYVKYAVTPALYVAGRGDYFYEKVAKDGEVTASAIFWPTTWVASGTATVAYQPADGVSVRLEYRHDHAASDVFFGGDVAVDPVAGTFIPDRKAQDTLLLGATAWF
jgi:hypothetical protein